MDPSLQKHPRNTPETHPNVEFTYKMAKRTRRVLTLLNSDHYRNSEDSTQSSSVSYLSPAQKNHKENTGHILNFLDNLSSDRDTAIRTRNLFILLNVVVSIVLMICCLELEFNPKKCEIERHHLTNQFKVCISIGTVLLLVQICEYYIRVMRIEVETNAYTVLFKSDSMSKRKKVDYEDPDTTPLIEITENPKPKTTMSNVWTVLRTSSIPRKFCCEILVCLPHMVPFAPLSLDVYLGLCMFLRLYIIFRVLRDYSSLYRKRKLIERIPGYSHATHPKVDTFMSIKMYFYQYPIVYVSVYMVFCTFILGYGVWVFEREAPAWNPYYFAVDSSVCQPHGIGSGPYLPIDSYWLAVYVIINGIFMGWGSDTFAIYNPASWPGRGIALFSVFAGVFLFALLVDYVHSRMQPSTYETIAMQWVMMGSLVEKERHEAAKLIQLVWRSSCALRRAKGSNTPKSKQKRMNTNFEMKYVQQLKALRYIRREKRKVFKPYEADQNESKKKKDTADASLQEVKKDILKEITALKQMLLELKQQKSEIISDKFDVNKTL